MTNWRLGNFFYFILKGLEALIFFNLILKGLLHKISKKPEGAA
jgi:hypothetical protein